MAAHGGLGAVRDCERGVDRRRLADPRARRSPVGCRCEEREEASAQLGLQAAIAVIGFPEHDLLTAGLSVGGELLIVLSVLVRQFCGAQINWLGSGFAAPLGTSRHSSLDTSGEPTATAAVAITTAQAVLEARGAEEHPRSARRRVATDRTGNLDPRQTDSGCGSPLHTPERHPGGTTIAREGSPRCGFRGVRNRHGRNTDEAP